MPVHRLIVLALLCFSLALAQASERLFTIDDMFAIQEIHKVVPSPDGERFAVVVSRPHAEGERYGTMFLLFAERSDVWLVRRAGEATRITDGAQEGSTYWSPLWSPDGRRLAMLSNQGGDNVRLYAWDSETDRVTRLAEEAVDLEFNAGGTGSANRVAAAWVSDRELLTALLPEGEVPLPYVLAKPQGLTVPRWETMQTGRESSVSVLEGGVVIPGDERPARNRLTLIDAETGEATVLAEGHFKTLSLAPGGRYAALAAAAENRLLSPDEPLRFPPNWNAYTFEVMRHYELGVLDLEARSGIDWVTGIHDPDILSPLEFPRWSQDGSRFAVVGQASRDDAPRELLIVDAETARAEAVGEGYAMASLVWHEGALLAQREGLEAVDVATLEAVALALPDDPPSALVAADLGPLVLAGGALYAAEDGALRRLTAEDAPAITHIEAPSPLERLRGPVEALLVGTAEGMQRVTFDGGEARFEEVVLPHEDAWLEAYVPATNAAVFQWVGPEGTYLWVGDPTAGDYNEALALNEHLAGIAEPERRVFDYESERGESLQAFLLLPPGYMEGEPLPLIVDVYPMRVIFGLDRYDADTNYAGFNHLQRYTSRGFAVLVPSMPLPLDEAPIDPMLELAGTVLPAVDKAIEVGIADPERLGLFGHSYGGYAVLGLLTQTDRFRAAVASAAYSDLALYHRTIYPHYRYDAFANELAALVGAEFEDPDLSVLRLLGSPSGDLERYIRNSPVHHLDAITTPLLLLHGELDGVSLEQAEAVFMGLQRLGKRVSLARYWGEGHILNSPANLRDSWERTLDWFEEHF